MSNELLFPRINLQLFAEGAGTGAAGATGVSSGDPGQSATAGDSGLTSVQYGKQSGEVSPAVSQDDRNARFEEMIKGEYKDLYDARVQDIVQRRLKNTKDTVDRYNALAPTLDLLSKKYGVDASDIQALTAAIEEDDSYYEDEAMEKGITVEQLKEIRKMEKENAELKAQMRQRQVQENADRIYASWMNQSQALKQVYPGFDLNTELQNPRFTDLLRNNIDVRTAYEVVHKDEIIPAAMNFTAQRVEENIARKIASGSMRPMENGMSSQSSSVVKSDVSMLSKADRQEINRRVARGEKIRF